MSIQNKYDLVLLGNITVDEIYCIKNWPNENTSNKFQFYKSSVGGLGNIIKMANFSNLNILLECVIGDDNDGKIIKKYLKKYNIKTTLHKSDKPTSKALILSNLQSAERTSFVNWGCGVDLFVPKFYNSRWTHISYLDVIPFLNIKHIRKNSNIISADLCFSTHPTETIKMVCDQLQYIDFLFVSESEIVSLINDITKTNLLNFVNLYKLNCLIFHGKQKTIIVKNNYYEEIFGTHQLVNYVNVLGAGDVYCANFILHQLNHTVSLKKSVIHAHKQATKFVLSKNNEKI